MDFILHIDRYLVQIVNEYQSWTYLILFLVIFSETGLVVTPFLPGDSVLFAMGALIALPGTDINLWVMMILLILAAVSGDFMNYEFGKLFGRKVFTPEAKVFKLSYLEKTTSFYDKHGSKTIIYARFVPIVRTFAPFVAGISRMRYRHFGKFNMIGGVLWVSLFLGSGYLFGQIDFIKNNFSFVVLAIICISLLPPLFEFLKSKRTK